ncbi:MAG TPA: peptidyl-prolyl cis-trans isomerase [Conexibacter sp.]|nr:peptidyl-prolyl cis-trans isomerase [Conexibacter sp.]
MTKPIRILLALCAFFALAFTVAACGGDDDSGNEVPSNAVASVDGEAVSKADYDRWAEITAKSASAQGGEAVVPDPPTYARCIAALTRQAEAVRGQRVPAESALRAQCRQLDTQIRSQTMALLIQAIWFDKEAEDLGVSVTDRDVERLLAETKRQSFPRRGDYERFLRQSGMTEEDVLFRLRVNDLGTRISEKIQRSAGNVTEAQITDYYNRNREQFAVPERRDLEIVLTRTEAQAEEAKRAIEGGTSWAAAARRYSTDALSKGNGGRLAGVARGQQDRALDTAAFNAREDVIVGPVRGQFGWYIVRVTGVTPARQSSLADSREQIRELLRQQNSTRELTEFGREFQSRWRRETNCRREYVIADFCANAPRTTTPTSTAGGAVATSTTP